MKTNETSYAAWIGENVDAETKGYGECREVCEAMAEAFPELEIRKGIFHSIAWSDRTHWWLRHRKIHTAIVDPTGRQHPDGSWFPDPSIYEDLADMTEAEAIVADKIPVGKCPDCGGPVWASSNSGGLCSVECARSYAAYIGGGAL